MLRSANMLQIWDVAHWNVFLLFLRCFRQYSAVKRVKCSATVPLFCSNYQNNSILSPGFLSQRFNNLQKAALLTSFWCHWFDDKILSKFGQQQLLMVNYACGFNQSETGKYFEWIMNDVIGWGFSRVKAEADNTYWDLDYLHSSPTLQIPAYYGRLVIVDSLLCLWGKKTIAFSLNSTHLIWTPHYGHFLRSPQCPY